MRLLVLGGSGFLSGTVVREALAAGHEVSIVTRGNRPVPGNINAICADRKDRNGFAKKLAAERDWDLVVDCIGFDADDARQDLSVFSGRCRHLAFVSTDFVYDPARRVVPQAEEPAFYLEEGYGGKKRAAECVFLESGIRNWTIFRPGHIYGPGSQLGCLPLHGRDPELLVRLKNGEPLRLVGGGLLLQHPVFAPDLAKTILSLAGNVTASGRIFNVANPDIIESRRYYEIIAEVLGVKAVFEAVDLRAFLAENPDKASFCCDRVSDLSLLTASGLHVPATPIGEGLRCHVHALQTSVAAQAI